MIMNGNSDIYFEVVSHYALVQNSISLAMKYKMLKLASFFYHGTFLSFILLPSAFGLHSLHDIVVLALQVSNISELDVPLICVLNF